MGSATPTPTNTHPSTKIPMSGPGLLYVTSSISQPALLSEAVYMHWYDSDHIAEIMQTSGIKNAHRYIDVDMASGNVDKPYLAFYPMADLAFTQSDEFRKIKVHSEILPGSGLCYDLADIDVRYYQLVQVFDVRGAKGTGMFWPNVFFFFRKVPFHAMFDGQASTLSGGACVWGKGVWGVFRIRRKAER